MRNPEDSKSEQTSAAELLGSVSSAFHHVRETGDWRKRLASTEPTPLWERGDDGYLLQECIRTGKMMTLVLW